MSSRDDKRVLVVQNPSGDDIRETIQVEVYDGPTPVTEYGAKKLWDRLRPQYERLGWSPKLRQFSVHQVGELRGLSIDFDIRPSTGADEIRYWHFWTSGNDRTYAVSFAAGASRFENHREQFTTVLRSFHIQPVAERPFMIRLLTNPLVLSILFMLYLNRYLLRRRRKNVE